MKRVLVYIPAGNGVPVERITAVDIREAQAIVEHGQMDKNSWYAGAYIVTDKKDYPRYGYKDCEKNGVLRDEKLKNLTRSRYEALDQSKKTVDDLSEETEATILSKFLEMQQRLEQLEAEAAKGEAQIASEKHAEAKQLAVDEAMVQPTEE